VERAGRNFQQETRISQMRSLHPWRLRTRSLELGSRTLVMGVVNVTPDSFFDGGRFVRPEAAIEHALRVLDEGADILDIGGESTRPGTVLYGETGPKPSVSPQEELDRVLPVLEAVSKERPHAVLSVDTYKSVVARAAVSACAEIVNDVSAFQWDPAMAAACAELGCGVVMMHTRGRPTEWRNLERAVDIVSEVEHDLANRVQVAFEAGVHRERIVLDPGFGFGKNFEDNYPLLAEFGRFHRLGFPLLAGVSRKSFIGRAIAQRTGNDVPVTDRLNGSLAAMVACILQGAHIVRVHDVKASVEAAAVADAILASESTASC
jgi:dihydropteroate synthase